MGATLRILEAGGAALDITPIEVGEEVYKRGISAGITPEALAALSRTKVVLKAPITTPQGGGYKSLNVTIRKTFGLFANVRPCIAYSPYVQTKHPKMDLVVIRENEEDTYGGIEHRQTQEVTQCLKLITVPGSEKIVRYAFEYARAFGRKKITCMTKDNIMKLTDGLFHKTFDRVAKEYPEIETDHLIIDIGMARVADSPDRFDVIVMPNLYGDILSDVAAQLTGSVGLVGTANIGNEIAMFEAIHGSAPDIAGKGIANPSGLLLAGVQMLVYLGQTEAAERIHNAWLKTLEDGVHTGDLHREGMTVEQVGTQGFADAVIERMGQTPTTLKAVSYAGSKRIPTIKAKGIPLQEKKLVGVDVFVEFAERNPDKLGKLLKPHSGGPFSLLMITNRGTKVWPNGAPETFSTDHWRCRFSSPKLTVGTFDDVLALQQKLNAAGVAVIKTENLYTFDGEPGFSLGQGQ